jgi:hypothetical protein
VEFFVGTTILGCNLPSILEVWLSGDVSSCIRNTGRIVDRIDSA